MLHISNHNSTDVERHHTVLIKPPKEEVGVQAQYDPTSKH